MGPGRGAARPVPVSSDDNRAVVVVAGHVHEAVHVADAAFRGIILRAIGRVVLAVVAAAGGPVRLVRARASEQAVTNYASANHVGHISLFPAHRAKARSRNGPPRVRRLLWPLGIIAL